MDLIWYEKIVLYKWLTGTPNAGLIPGVFGFAGDLCVQNGLTARLLLRVTPVATAGLTFVEDCFNFPYCILIETAEMKMGVEKSVWRLRFRALPQQLPTASFGALLFNFSCV